MRRVTAAATLGLLCLAAMPAEAQRRDDFTTPPQGLQAYGFGSVGDPAGSAARRVGQVGRVASDNLCLPPSYNGLALQDPGGNPGTCYFKSETRTRQCDCSVFTYKKVYSVAITNNGSNAAFAPREYEEPVGDSQCVSYVNASTRSCPGTAPATDNNICATAQYGTAEWYQNCYQDTPFVGGSN